MQEPLPSLSLWALPWWPKTRAGKRKRKRNSKKSDTLGDISKSLLCHSRRSLYEWIIIYSTGSPLRGLQVVSSLFLTNTAFVNIPFMCTRIPVNKCSGVELSCQKLATLGASLVVWWLRSWLAMQGTQFQSLVWEDPTCCGAPLLGSSWGNHAPLLASLEPVLCNKRNPCDVKPADQNQSSPHSLQLEQAHEQQHRPSTVENK